MPISHRILSIQHVYGESIYDFVARFIDQRRWAIAEGLNLTDQAATAILRDVVQPWWANCAQEVFDSQQAIDCHVRDQICLTAFMDNLVNRIDYLAGTLERAKVEVSRATNHNVVAGVINTRRHSVEHEIQLLELQRRSLDDWAAELQGEDTLLAEREEERTGLVRTHHHQGVELWRDTWMAGGPVDTDPVDDYIDWGQ